MATTKKAQAAKLAKLDKKFVQEGLEYPFLGKFRVEGCRHPERPCSGEFGGSTEQGFCRVELLAPVTPESSRNNRPSVYVAASVCYQHALSIPFPEDERFTLRVRGSLVMMWTLGATATSLDKGRWRKLGHWNIQHLRPVNGFQHDQFRHAAIVGMDPARITVPGSDPCEHCGRTDEPNEIHAHDFPSYLVNQHGDRVIEKALKPIIFQHVPKVMTEEFLRWHYTRRSLALAERNRRKLEREQHELERNNLRATREIENAMKLAGIEALS